MPRPDFPLSMPVYIIIKYIIIPYNCMNRGFLKFLYNIFKPFGQIDGLLIISSKFSNIVTYCNNNKRDLINYKNIMLLNIIL